MNLLQQAIAERDRLNKVIDLLESGESTTAPVSRTRKSSSPKRHGRVMSAAAKAAMSRKLKAIWAQKKKASAARSKAAKARVAKKGA
jgi:hypothetical protein